MQEGDRAAGGVRQLLLAGAGLAALGLAIGMFGIVLHAGHDSHDQPQRTMIATVVAAVTALTALVLCWGLLRFPGVAPTAGAASRLVLDGVATGAALWFVGWVLLSEPTHLLGAATPRACPALLVASATAAGAIGLTFVVALRATRPRRGALLVGNGTSLIALCGLGLAAGICQVGPVLAVPSAVVLPTGLVILTSATRLADRPADPGADVVRRGAGYAFVPMVAVALSAAYHLNADGSISVSGTAAWMVAGFAMVTRQYLTLMDASGYAETLSHREAHFRELAHTDPLTGLANRRGLLRALGWGRPGSTCVLLAVDMDGFKQVNDTRGHDVGDAVLADIARRLRHNLRAGDVAARLGGDEFAVLMWSGLPEAIAAAERLRDVLSRPYRLTTGPLVLSASIGLASCGSADSIQGLLRNADLALRAAKQAGKNRVEQYDRGYDRRIRRRATLEQELRGAIDRGELHLAYQPVVAVPSARPVGAEALLRWQHPRLGAVGPDEFIPLAEECGMIADLGAFVLHEACRQLSLWFGAGHDLWLSVNVSPLELDAPAYGTRVDEALRAHYVPPQRLVLEVTEHAVATNVDEMSRRLCALQSLGLRIALDDFGAGYSSLGQLRRLPIDLLKIDQSLVAVSEDAWAVNGGGSAPMVDVVVRLGHQLGLEVIAEGVSNQAELMAVTRAGCRFGQGQLFGYPVPAEHFEAMIEAAAPARAVPAQRFARTASPLPASPLPASPLPPHPPWPPAAPAARRPSGSETPTGAHHVGLVDSAREMRQA
ncbi:MAG TPA: bifunctional diguanylate cyclase/phosphodiesterase [Micromonosporaceae bacterium]